MALPILATKLYIPPPRPGVIPRLRLIERLNEGAHRKLALVSAPAGFGKTTLVSEWVAACDLRIAWLSLDEGDHDPIRFLVYVVAALQTIAPSIGVGISAVLQSPQPPPVKSILTTLLNEITSLPEAFALILDDYHLVDDRSIDEALTFLLENLPPQMHLVISTREDPGLPLARLRARGQLTELRAADLRFTPAEAAGFLNQVMGLNLSPEDIAALETRTEGWIAGLQLAAISIQGSPNVTSFIQSFTGSHHFVLDYLLEEVLQQQSESIQTFLLRTSVLDRLCGPLCDAVCSCETDAVRRDASLQPTWPASGQETLEYLERANLFIVPLDNERHWYRYHHLFADLLRQRLHNSLTSTTEGPENPLKELHIRASQWYEDHGLEMEAFHHAAAANDIDRAERLIEGGGIPLQVHSAVVAALDWLASLPTTVLDARPSLWWRYASLLLVNGQSTGVEEKLQAAETALRGNQAQQSTETDETNRNLIGQIATARATLALSQYQIEPMVIQSRRALEYLDPSNLTNRATANWTLGFAYGLLGERIAARQAFIEAISLSQKAGNIFTTILATIGLGDVQEADNELFQAAETHRRVLQLVGDQPPQVACESHLSLARIMYEWNDLDAAEEHGIQSLHLARQYERVIDRYVISEVFLARLKLARGDVAGADGILAEASQSARQQNFVHRIPEVAALQILTLLRQGNLAAAAALSRTYPHPLSQARVLLAQEDASAALGVLEPWRRQVESKGWVDEKLRVMVLQAVALHLRGERDRGVQVLGDALALAEPGGFIRIFIDEGFPMRQLLSEAAKRGIAPYYIDKLQAVFETELYGAEGKSPQTPVFPTQPLIGPLSQRELEILRLIAQGLSNGEIGKRLFLALDTVKGHNRVIFDKLQVQNRTEAVARARDLGLL